MIPMLMSGVAVAAAGAASARWNWWRRPLPGATVLMYHKVGNPPEDSKLKKLWVSSDMFRRQMTYLKDKGYNPITFKDLYASSDKGIALPSSYFLIMVPLGSSTFAA